MKANRNQRFSVINKKDSVNGKTSIVLAAVSAAALIICVALSVLNDGSAPGLAGAVGLGAILLALYGFFISMKDLSEKKNRTKTTYFGAIFAGVMFLIWVTIILAGIKN